MWTLKRLQWTATHLLSRKKWQHRETPMASSYEEQVYQALIHPGDVCFDVGANQGDVSLFLAKLAGEFGLVTAFEPVWPTYCQLCRAVQRDTTLKAPIITVPYGLADSEKQSMIHIPGRKFALGSIADASAWATIQRGAQIRSHPVQLTTIDSFLLSTGSQAPDFIKIDVEGAELFVLRGGAGLFSADRRPLMLIEIFAPWERAFGYHPWAPLSWLLERGYRFLFACPTGMVEYLPTETRPFPPDYEMGYNVVVYDPNKHAARINRIDPMRAGQPETLLPMAPPPQPNR